MRALPALLPPGRPIGWFQLPATRRGLVLLGWAWTIALMLAIPVVRGQVAQRVLSGEGIDTEWATVHAAEAARTAVGFLEHRVAFALADGQRGASVHPWHMGDGALPKAGEPVEVVRFASGAPPMTRAAYERLVPASCSALCVIFLCTGLFGGVLLAFGALELHHHRQGELRWVHIAREDVSRGGIIRVADFDRHWWVGAPPWRVSLWLERGFPSNRGVWVPMLLTPGGPKLWSPCLGYDGAFLGEAPKWVAPSLSDVS